MEGKVSNVTIGLHMNGVPLSLYKRFIKDIDQYNGTYYVKLMDIMRKAEAYDKLMEIRIITQVRDEFKQEEKENKQAKTLGGLSY